MRRNNCKCQRLQWQPIVRIDCEFYITWPRHISSQAHLVHAVLLLPSALPMHLIVLHVSVRALFGGSWPRFFFPTQTTAFWGCWSRGKGSERPRLLWRSGDSERNSPRKPRRHSEHTDTLFLQKYTICFNDQYQKTKQNLRLKLRLEHWGGDDARVDKMQSMDWRWKTITDHEHVHTCTYNSRASVCCLMFAFDQCKGWHMDLLRATLPYVNIWRNHNEMSEKKMTGNGKLWCDTLVVHWWKMNCFEDKKKCASLGLTWEA